MIPLLCKIALFSCSPGEDAVTTKLTEQLSPAASTTSETETALSLCERVPLQSVVADEGLAVNASGSTSVTESVTDEDGEEFSMVRVTVEVSPVSMVDGENDLESDRGEAFTSRVAEIPGTLPGLPFHVKAVVRRL